MKTLRRLLWAVIRWTAIAATAVVAITVLQVLLARVVDPPLTLTMVEVMWADHAPTGTWHGVEHTAASLDSVGDTVPRAVVAAEDGRFWHHHGFDFAAIRDVLDDGDTGSRGASTISQQTARNVFLWQGRTWVRKGLEAWYTVWLELLVPKERILELYLGVAQTGPLTFGFESGARHWYGIPARSLSWEQAAGLAAILPSPAHRDPRQQDDRAQRILSRRVPFPGDAGFDAAARLAQPLVSPRALIGPARK